MLFNAASNLGRETDGVFILFLVVCGLLLAGITFFMLFFTVRYRRRRHPEAAVHLDGNTTLEIAWTVGGVALVLVLFYWGWGGYKARTLVPPEAMDVKVTARMWSWAFTYPNGAESDTLKLPYGRPVRLLLSSRDTIHSLYIPAFKVKQDVVPGSKNYLWFTPDEPGEYDLFCAEYCGAGHYRMLTRVVVMAPEEFDTWYGEALAVPAEAAAAGEKLYRTRGCIGCHSIDGTRLVGPTFKGLYGKTETVTTEGVERTLIVDDEYLRRSMVDPEADIVSGYPPVMPSQEGVLSEDEISAIIEYIKTLGLGEPSPTPAIEEPAVAPEPEAVAPAITPAPPTPVPSKKPALPEAPVKAEEKAPVTPPAPPVKKKAEEKEPEPAPAPPEQEAPVVEEPEKKVVPEPPAPPAEKPALPAEEKEREKPAEEVEPELKVAPTEELEKEAPVPPAPPVEEPVEGDAAEEEAPPVEEETRPVEPEGPPAAEEPPAAEMMEKSEEPAPSRPVETPPDGQALYRSKGCITCHSIDGTSGVGPTLKGLFGMEKTVITEGQERTVTVDDEYILRSVVDPKADVVKGFPPIMPSQRGVLSEDEIKALINFIKSLE